MKKVITYIKQREETSSTDKIHIAAFCENDLIYGIEVRFPATAYECKKDGFKTMKNVLNRRSGGTLKTVSSFKEFHSGTISFRVAFCNHGYSDAKLVKTLDLLFTEILPSFRK